MKIAKYILLFAFSLILIGIFGKSVVTMPGADAILVLGLLIYLITGLIYIIITLVKRKQRIEAGMIAISGMLVTGLLFKNMFWTNGGMLVIIGSQILLFGSIGVFIYCKIKKRKIVLAALFLVVGLSSLFFCFKFMRWPGASPLFTLTVIGLVILAYTVFKNGLKLNISRSVSIIIILLIIATYISSESQLYRFRVINSEESSLNYPENYHIYSWMLYKEGEINQAKENLKLAIIEAENSNNIHFKKLERNSEQSIERYKRAMKLLETGKWLETERAQYSSY